MKKDIDFLMENFYIDDALGFIINRASIIMRKHLTSMIKEAGYYITPEEFSILSRLWEEEGILQTELIEKTLKDKTRVTRLLGGLAKKSLIKKETNEVDRRNHLVYLTDEGKALRAKIILIVITLMKQAAEGIDPSDVDITKKVLRRIFENLNSM